VSNGLEPEFEIVDESARFELWPHQRELIERLQREGVLSVGTTATSECPTCGETLEPGTWHAVHHLDGSPELDPYPSW